MTEQIQIYGSTFTIYSYSNSNLKICFDEDDRGEDGHALYLQRDGTVDYQCMDVIMTQEDMAHAIDIAKKLGNKKIRKSIPLF